jgi:hypothetical protein
MVIRSGLLFNGDRSNNLHEQHPTFATMAAIRIVLEGFTFCNLRATSYSVAQGDQDCAAKILAANAV